MSSLELQLRELVAANWAMVYQLHARAEAFRGSLLDKSRTQFEESRGQSSLDGGDAALKNSSCWYVTFSAQKPVSYVQVGPVETSAPQVKVWTGFFTTGVGQSAVKRMVQSEFGHVMDVDNPSQQRAETVRKNIPFGHADLDALATQIAEEVHLQLPVARRIRDFIVSQARA